MFIEIEITGVDVETLRTDSLTDWIWQRYLSHCPWLVTTRQTFFDDLILSKVTFINILLDLDPINKLNLCLCRKVPETMSSMLEA